MCDLLRWRRALLLSFSCHVITGRWYWSFAEIFREIIGVRYWGGEYGWWGNCAQIEIGIFSWGEGQGRLGNLLGNLNLFLNLIPPGDKLIDILLDFITLNEKLKAKRKFLIFCLHFRSVLNLNFKNTLRDCLNFFGYV